MERVFLKAKTGLELRSIDVKGWPHIKAEGHTLPLIPAIRRKIRSDDPIVCEPPDHSFKQAEESANKPGMRILKDIAANDESEEKND